MSKESTVIRNSFERDMVVHGTHIRLKSVFQDKISLEKALANIATRKLAQSKKQHS